MITILNKVSAILVITSILAQSAAWYYIPHVSNWTSLKYSQWKKHQSWKIERNKTLAYKVNLEVLEEPLIVKYAPNKSNLKIIDILKKRWYKAENYNYLWLKKEDEIKYPFHIKHIYTIQNKENHDITIEPSFFPLKDWSYYPRTKELGESPIYIWEAYWVKDPEVKINKKVIKVSRKYKSYTFSNSWERWDIVLPMHYIQNEWKWNINIPAKEVVEVEFSYYSTDIKKRSTTRIENEKHYLYYHAGLNIEMKECLCLPLLHRLTLPKWYSVIFPSYWNYRINWPLRKTVVPIYKNTYIEIIKD